MSENKETSLEAEEKMFMEQAMQADAQGVSVNELSQSISDNSGANADPVEEVNEEETDTTNPSNDGSEQSDTSESTQENGVQNPNQDEGTQSATSSEAKNLTKAQKEEARRDKSWKKLEEEKAAFAREKAEWETQKLKQTQNLSPSQNLAENPSALANAFDEIAKQFEDSGDFDKADEAREKAKELRAKTSQDNTQQVQQASSNPQFKVAWNAHMERAINDFPEMKDINSDFGKTVQALLRAPDTAQLFNNRPDGIYIAAQLANMKMTALRVPALEKENATLKEEIKKLRQGMSIPSSGANGRAGDATSINNMSLEQQEAYFMKQAELADAQARVII